MRYDINNKYVVRTPDDAIHSKFDGPCKIDLYIPPCGSGQINEVRDSTYVLGNFRLPYHYHDKGVETFIVHKGCVQVTLNGKRFILEEGDIINIEPWCPHGFVFIDEGVVLREMFTDAGTSHRTFSMPEPVDCEWVGKNTVLEVTCKGEGKEVFAFEGIKFLLKVGRWQLRGFKEVWEYQMKKGYQLQLGNASESEGVYFVKGGRFIVEINGEVLFASAEEGDLIHIPAYSSYTLTAVSDECVIHDFNVSAHLFRLLEMIEAAQDYFPEKLKDSEYMGYLLEANNVHNFTSFKKPPLIETDHKEEVGGKIHG